MKHLFTYLILLSINTLIYAQTPVLEDLKKQLSNEHNEKSQRELLIKICMRHYSISTDSFLTYIDQAEKIAEAGTPDYFLINNFYCIYLSKTGHVAEALLLADSLLSAIPALKDFEKVKSRLLINKSNLLIRSNQSEAAIRNTLAVLSASEENKDTLLIMHAYTIMGYAYLEMENYNEAINWLNKGFHFTTDENILKQSGFLFSNNASCYNNTNKMDSAFYFIDLALKYGSMDENLSVQTNALNIRADMYIKEKKYALAEDDLKAALKLREKAGDLLMLSADMAQLSSFYASTNQTDKGIAIAKKGIESIEHTHNLSKLLFLYNALAENYNKANLLNEYAQTLEKIITIKDTLYAKTSEDAIAEMTAKYELEKKEKIILQQNYILSRNKYLTIGVIFLMLSGALISYLYYRNFQHRQNLKLQEMIAEEKRKSQEAIILAEEKERKRIAADLHDNLGSYAAAISSNVKFLKDNFNDTNIEVTAQLEENAQNIVTQLSDTIWVLKNERLMLTQLADRFKSWMQRWMKNYPDIKYFYDETIENDLEFSPEKILHIFLIMKECITNAAKHARCKNIKVNFICTNKLKIIIADDGIGINESNLTGNGIGNMKQRAAMSNLSIVWQQAEPQGTAVIVTGITTN